MTGQRSAEPAPPHWPKWSAAAMLCAVLLEHLRRLPAQVPDPRAKMAWCNAPRSLLTPPNCRALSLHAPAKGKQLRPGECAAIYVGTAYEADCAPNQESVRAAAIGPKGGACLPIHFLTSRGHGLCARKWACFPVASRQAAPCMPQGDRAY